MSEPEAIPQKPYYKVSEVCQFTNTQPYVLRFWESEFPQLAPDRSRGGQSVYRKRDIDVVLRIKQLLYDEEYTIAGARRQLEQELSGESAAPDPPAPLREPRRRSGVRVAPEIIEPVPREEPPAAVAPDPPAPLASAREADLFDNVPRERYEDAVDEIAHLRLKLQEAEAQLRKNENALRKAEEAASTRRDRLQHAADRLEKLLDRLS